VFSRAIFIPQFLAALVLTVPIQASEWFQQCGPDRDANVPVPTAGKLATSFPGKKIPLLWKTNAGMGAAPVAWRNYVIDALYMCQNSKTWCIQIVNNQPKLVWEQKEFIPYNKDEKSNFIIKDGKVYGIDANGLWGDPDMPDEEKSKHASVIKFRNDRDKNLGQFQCRDVATGKLFWSSDVLAHHVVPDAKWKNRSGVTYDVLNRLSAENALNEDFSGKNGTVSFEWYPTKSIIAGDLLIANGFSGLWIARLKENGMEILARGTGDTHGSEPVLVDGLLYVRKFDSSKEGNLSCYDLRSK